MNPVALATADWSSIIIQHRNICAMDFSSALSVERMRPQVHHVVQHMLCVKAAPYDARHIIFPEDICTP